MFIRRQPEIFVGLHKKEDISKARTAILTASPAMPPQHKYSLRPSAAAHLVETAERGHIVIMVEATARARITGPTLSDRLEADRRQPRSR